MSELKPRIVIVGGGIVGILLAVSLTNLKIPYTLYEREPGFVTQGAGIGIGPNSRIAMKLLDERYHALYKEIATRNADKNKSNVMFDVYLAEDQSYPGFEVSSGPFRRNSAHRKQLLDIGKELLPEGVVRFGKEAVGIEERDDGSVAVIFKDGEVAVGDAVIGCDGGKGPFREYVVGKEFLDATYSGVYAYRSILPMDKAVEILGNDARNSRMYLAKNRHIMTYPITQGTQLNVIAFQRAEEDWTYPAWQKPVLKEEMVKEFEGFSDPLVKLVSVSIDMLKLSSSQDNDTFFSCTQMLNPVQWALFHNLNTPTYFRNRVVLLGDSAHASTPHQAAGAGQGLEDTLIFSRLLAKATSLSDLPHIFKVYDHFRRPRAQKVVRTSNEAGIIYDFCDPKIGADMEALEQNLKSRFDWIWKEDLEGTIEKAEQMLIEVRGSA